MIQKEIIQFYDDFAEKYDETVFQQKDYIAFQLMPLWLLEALPGQKMTICDLGCGTGLGSCLFLEKRHEVVGIDISPKMIEQAQKLPFKKLICHSLEERLPFENEEFDAVQMLGVMEFISDPKNLFKEIFRILKQGGLFAITIPEKNLYEKDLGIFSFDRNEIEQTFNNQGFTIIKHEQFQGFVYKEKKVIYSGYLLKKS